MCCRHVVISPTVTILLKVQTIHELPVDNMIEPAQADKIASLTSHPADQSKLQEADGFYLPDILAVNMSLLQSSKWQLPSYVSSQSLPFLP